MSLDLTYAKALEAFNAGKFSEAQEALIEATKSGVTSAQAEHLLGRVFIAQEKHFEAQKHLYQSILLDRYGNPAYRDLEILQKKLGSQVASPMAHPSEWGAKISFYFPMPSWGIFLIIWATLSLLIAWKSQWRLAQKFVVIAGFIFIFSMSALVYSSHKISLVTQETALRPAAIESSKETQMLSAGTRVRVIKESGDFVEIERTGSFRGWVKMDSLFSLPK